MARLLDKLNVLIKSNLRSVFSDRIPHRQSDAAPSGSAPDAGVERQIAQLRDRINAALDQEERTLEELDAMQQQIAIWDAEADRALQAGDEATARYNVRQIQLTQQQHALLAADLEQHRRSTAKLIQQVNALETAIAHTQQAHVQQQPSTNDEIDTDDDSLADRLRRARQKATGATRAVSAKAAASVRATASDANAADADAAEVDSQRVEEDLKRRRERLSL